MRAHALMISNVVQATIGLDFWTVTDSGQSGAAAPIDSFKSSSSSLLESCSWTHRTDSQFCSAVGSRASMSPTLPRTLPLCLLPWPSLISPYMPPQSLISQFLASPTEKRDRMHRNWKPPHNCEDNCEDCEDLCSAVKVTSQSVSGEWGMVLHIVLFLLSELKVKEPKKALRRHVWRNKTQPYKSSLFIHPSPPIPPSADHCRGYRPNWLCLSAALTTKNMSSVFLI